MNKIFLTLLASVCTLNVWAADSTLQKATASDIAAGINDSRFITSKGLRGVIGSSNSVFSSDPFITVSARGVANGQSTIINGGFQFGPDNGGIAAALNYLNTNLTYGPYPRGIKLCLTEGLFEAGQLSITNSFPNSLSIIGAAEIGSQILFTNTSGDALDINGSPSATAMHLYFQDVGFVMKNNILVNLLDLQHVAKLYAVNCYFTVQPALTNAVTGVNLATINSVLTSPPAVIGVNVHNSLDDGIIFNACHFNGLAVGILSSIDHLYVNNCQFNNIGIYSGGTTNAYPTSSPAWAGACVLLDAAGFEAYINNPHFFYSRCGLANLEGGGGNYVLTGGTCEGVVYPYMTDDSFGGTLLFNFNGSVVTNQVVTGPPWALAAGDSTASAQIGLIAEGLVSGGSAAFFKVTINGKSYSWNCDGSWSAQGNGTLTGYGITADSQTIPTNTAAFTMRTNAPFAMGGTFTNRNQRALGTIGWRLTSAGAGNTGGFYWTNIDTLEALFITNNVLNVVQAGTLTFGIGPNERIKLVNVSAGTGAAAIDYGRVQNQ